MELVDSDKFSSIFEPKILDAYFSPLSPSKVGKSLEVNKSQLSLNDESS